MKKAILITDTAPLYPPLWGGPKRIWNLYNGFPEELFDITYIGVGIGIGGVLKYSFNRINNNFKEILCSLPSNYHYWHAFEKAIFRNTSLDLFLYLWMDSDRQFKYALNSRDYDIVICSHPWASLCLNKKRGQFFIYDAHNCEYLLMRQVLGSHPLKGFVLKRVRRIEGDACRKSDLIIACSENEKRDLLDLYKINPGKVVVITNGSGIKSDTTAAERENSRKNIGIDLNDKAVVFIGAYYKPNIEAVRFIKERIAAELNEFIFLIAGTVSDAFKEERMPPNMRFMGRLSEEELDTVLRASDIAINPMFEGSGINIKMLDYMAYGLPIVTTPCGARGIETGGRQPMLISTDEEFSQSIKRLDENRALSKNMSEDGRGLIAERYDWEKISIKLQDIVIKKL